LIKDAGCKFERLPPYSPDFNTIELSFSVIKKVVKNRYQVQSNVPVVEFADLISRVGMEAITPQIARNQFRHCRIYVP
jgi:hypothetical protein